VVVVVERGDGPPAARSEVLAVDQQNVRPAVAIVVEKGAARTQRFGQVLSPRAAGVVDEVDAGLSGDVGEDDFRARRLVGDEGGGGEGEAHERQVVQKAGCRGTP